MAQTIQQMRGDVPGIKIEDLLKMIAGDPRKMAHQIVNNADQVHSPLRMTLGSDAYQKIHASLSERLAALEAQKELADATDADDYQRTH